LHQIFRSLTHRRLLISFRSDRSSQLLTRFPSLYTTVSAKMVQNQGIDIYLAPFDHKNKRKINTRYPQHGVPSISSNFTGDPNEVYIEAVDGERFVVVLDLMKDFSMHGADHLYIEWYVDQDHASGRSDHYPLSELKAGEPRGKALKGRCTYDTIDRKIDGVWKTCGFTFTALDIGNEPLFVFQHEYHATSANDW
jgi:hypothetical protein